MSPTARMFGLAAATAVAALAWASTAGAAVTVIGGGKAKECSLAAFNGQKGPYFENICTEALESELMNPRDRAGTYVNRGILKLRRREYASAQTDFNRAIEENPAFGEAYVNRGAASVGQKRFAEGLADINKAIELGVDEPEKAYFNRALAFEGLDDMKAAYLDYQKALELKPGWEMPLKELSRFTVEQR
ncbi:tetratricopeptide repeat protein [uncultured Phenylobacterium sp.]|uniref:tetratricopeptide repeat protein n=1 Tax=uncultured Phenylobacterium sp. TaxID=349273 RepID=UPI0025D8CDFF|nr:tetratricopeptide repeat protein [uncultured Phenylobacterium sp.]